MTFKVQPQVPAKRNMDQRQSGFGKSQLNQFNVRFKPNNDTGSGTLPSEVSNNENNVPITFACNKTTVGFTERREKSDAPPLKKRKISRYPMNHSAVRLTSRKPVTAYVPMDAWSLIFRRCHPKFLIQARLVCRDFRDILKQQSIWREAREYIYGPSLPECPHDLHELEFAKLLVGRGCQIKGCTQRLTRKVYWAFMLRMCEQCFSERTQRPDIDGKEAQEYVEFREKLEPEVRQTIPNHLAGLLPAGSMWAGKFSQVRPIDNETQMWRFQDDPGNYCVMKDEFEDLKRDFTQKVVTEPSYFLFWARLHWGRTKARIEIAKEFDGHDVMVKNTSQKLEKVDFFQEMAEGLDPPMTPAVLRKMVAYHRAIDTPNAASLRAWDGLKAKIDIPELRKQAEQLLKWEREDTGWRASIEDDLYDKLIIHRRRRHNEGDKPVPEGNCCAEQQFVLDIANREVTNLIDIVHDEDVLLKLLDSVRCSYEAAPNKPHGLNGDGSTGQYRLLLDDARVVVTEVLMPLATNKGPVRAKTITNSLRCMACTRTDCHRTFTFDGLMVHIRNKHADLVGEDLHFWRFAVPIQSRIRRYTEQLAWYHIPWPKTIPALPYHRRAKPGLMWHPDEEQKYVSHCVEDEVHMFDKVEPIQDPTTNDDDFAGRVCKAVEILANTRLDSAAIIRIAFEYAARTLSRLHESDNSGFDHTVAQLQEMEGAIKTRTQSNVEFKFKCGLCMKDPTKSASGRRPRETLHPQPLSLLVPHWQNKHSLLAHTAQRDFIYLPSDFELSQAMKQEDDKLDSERRRVLLKNKKSKAGSGNTGAGENTKDPRAEALLEIPYIRDRFRMLFTPADGSEAADSSTDTSRLTSDGEDTD